MPQMSIQSFFGIACWHRVDKLSLRVFKGFAKMPPAARVGDMHVCPMVTGVVPHVGGPILPPGAPTVLTVMMPQARVGDMCTCVGPPDAIAIGSSTVLVGNMPAARMGDITVHGGSIVIGAPTVMIGG